MRLSYTAGGGSGELRGLLHQVGAAAFYARIPSPVLEFRRLGAVTGEAWALLFEGLAGDPGWLAERTGLAEGHLAPLVRAAAARRLHQARTLAARILIELARASGRDAAVAARPILERAFARAVETDELDLFLAERDPLLASADTLRALLLAAEAEQHLVALAHGPWWRSPASGAASSRRSPRDPGSACELVRALGAATLDGASLADSARARASAAGLRLVESPRVAR